MDEIQTFRDEGFDLVLFNVVTTLRWRIDNADDDENDKK